MLMYTYGFEKVEIKYTFSMNRMCKYRIDIIQLLSETKLYHVYRMKIIIVLLQDSELTPLRYQDLNLYLSQARVSS